MHYLRLGSGSVGFLDLWLRLHRGQKLRTFKSELKNSLLKSKTSLLFNCDKFADKSFAFKSELEKELTCSIY